MAPSPLLAARRLVIDEKCRPYSFAVAGPGDFRCHDDGVVDARIVLASPDISLYCLDPVARTVIFVETEPGVDLGAAPFSYQAQFAAATGLIAVDYNTVHALADRAPDVERLLLLYSVGRCGSTVVSRLLRATGGVASLSEPDVFTQLTAARQTGELTADEVSALVRSCTRLICAPRAPGPAPLVAIKFRSFVIHLAADFARHFPAARAVFLYRDAQSWATSTMRAFAPADDPTEVEEIATQDRIGRLLPLMAAYRERQGRLLTPIEMMACHWVGQMRDARSWPDGSLFALRYADLVAEPRAALAALYAHAGVRLPDDDVLDAVLAADSQSGSGLARASLDDKPARAVDPAELQRVIADLQSGQPGDPLTADSALPGTWRPRDPDGPIARRPAGSDRVPLSVLQERLYHLCTAYPGTSSPILYLCWRIRGPLDVAAWTRSVDILVDRHESLRTVFPVTGGAPAGRVGPPAGLPTERIDLSPMPAGDREADATALLSERVRALLDLATGPLVASILIDFTDDDHVWCFTVHHLLADGASMALLARDMRAVYTAEVDGGDAGIPALSIGYGDFAVWQQQADRAGDADGLKYWIDRLAGVPFLELPTDMARPPEKGTRIQQLDHVLSGDLVERLDTFAAAAGATLFMVLLAAMTALFTLESGQDDVCIGTLVAGRDRLETQPVVGLFYNTLALRCDTSGNPTFSELVDRTRRTAIEAYDRSGVPFGRIVTALDAPRDLSRTQVFQSMLILHTEQDTASVLDVADLSVDTFLALAPQSIHDLVWHAWRGPASLSLDMRFDGALFLPATITRMGQRFEAVLRAAIEEPQIRLFELAMLAQDAEG